MPLHCVTGADAEFDTLGVAELVDGRDQTQNGSNQFPTRLDVQEAARLTTNGSLSSLEELSFGRWAKTESTYYLPSGGRPSFGSLGSMNSAPILLHRNPYSIKNHDTIFEEGDSEMHAPKASYSAAENDTNFCTQNGWGQTHTPEALEEESISTLDDSISLSNFQQYQSSKMYHSHRRSFQQYPSRNFSILDNSQMSQASIQSHHIITDNSQKKSKNRRARVKCEVDHSPNSSTLGGEPGSPSYVSHLESHLAKLSLDLATTKTFMDKLQLENRLKHDEIDELKEKLHSLQDENGKLHLRIEKLEKEKLLRNMEGTIGVARPLSVEYGERDSKGTHKMNDINLTQRHVCSTVEDKKSRKNKNNCQKVSFYHHNDDDEKNSFTIDVYNSNSFNISLHSDIDDTQSVTMSLNNTQEDAHNDETDHELHKGEEDPFATWSSPEDREKSRNKQLNWFEKRLAVGKLSKNNNHQNPINIFPQSHEKRLDPFDTISKSSDNTQLSANNAQVYTPFDSGGLSVTNDATEGKSEGAKMEGRFWSFLGLGRQKGKK